MRAPQTLTPTGVRCLASRARAAMAAQPHPAPTQSSSPLAALLGRLGSFRQVGASSLPPNVNTGAFASTRPPRHLFVCVHGLAGRPEDLSALREALLRRKGGEAPPLVHLATANAHNRFATYDGIPAGAQRLAQEIRLLVAQQPSLTHLTLVGNSLGGLYARYAAALLYSEDGRIAGLEPVTFLTTATPHLGVGQHSHLALIPQPLQVVGSKVLGASIKELLLQDGDARNGREPLLLRMASERTSADQRSLPFLESLRAFKSRHVYANAVNDFLVAYETAAFMPEGAAERVGQLAGGAPRVLYTRQREPTTQVVPPAGGTPAAMQRRMALGLGSMRWSETAVHFPGFLPLAHNRIVALRRDPILTWLNACGAGVVEHTAQALLAQLQDEEEASAGTVRAGMNS